MKPLSSCASTRDGAGARRWLHTGDLGYLDEDGYLFIVDRKKDMIKTSGFQVWPREIEEALATHPAVAEVGVAGMSDPVKGEVVHAWVVLRAGETRDRAGLARVLPRTARAYKVPARVEFRRVAAEDDGREGAAAGAEGRDQAAPIALTVTPAASRPARSLAARSAGAGRVAVDADRVDLERRRSSRRSRSRPCPSPSGPHATRPTTAIVNDGARTLPRTRASRPAAYARSANASAATRSPAARPAFRSSEPGSPNRISDRSKAATARAMAAGEAGVAGRHVEERAVRLHVLEPDALGGGHAGDRGNLIEHEVLGLLGRHEHLAPAEADEIGKAGMGADGDAVRLGERGSCREGRMGRRRGIRRRRWPR